MIACCYILQFWQSKCFRHLDMMNTSAEDINILKFVSPLGWTALSFFLVSCSLLAIYLVWAKKETMKLLQKPLRIHLQRDEDSEADNGHDDVFHFMEPSEDLPLKHSSPSNKAEYGSMGSK